MSTPALFIILESIILKDKTDNVSLNSNALTSIKDGYATSKVCVLHSPSLIFSKNSAIHNKTMQSIESQLSMLLSEDGDIAEVTRYSCNNPKNKTPDFSYRNNVFSFAIANDVDLSKSLLIGSDKVFCEKLCAQSAIEDFLLISDM